ncbi:MAG: AEC family transporter [Burkholderiaceae bacterium]|nr:AEC family transporter [Burkholderiaceae bacterium]
MLAEIVAPVFLLIGVGIAAARAGLLDERAVKALSDAALLVFLPALLFGTIARVEFGQLSPGAALAYYGAGLPLFAVVLAVQVRRRVEVSAAVVHALGAVFSNTVMLGIPVVRLAFGETGLALLLTIIAVHALVFLTIGALVLELAVTLRGADAGDGSRLRRLARDLRPVIRASLLHPVVLPILLGVAWSAGGVALPRPVDSTLSMLGAAAAPLCLVLLGASLAQSGFGRGLATAAGLAAVKNLVHPALVWLVGRFVLDAAPLPLAIATVTAAMPVGANVYLFAQRYGTQVAEVSAAVTLSTLVSAATLPLLLALLG